MKKSFPHISILLGGLLIASVFGCSRKPADPTTQLNEAPPPELADAKAVQPTPGGARTPASTVNLEISNAMTAFKGGDYKTAVNQFYNLRANTVMSGDELIEVNKKVAAAMNDLYLRAEKGDAPAKAAIAEYERLKQNRSN